MTENPYDQIAQWYDVDMALNMRFDDIGFYAGLCQREGGKVLELGCGNGRILLELMRRGIDAAGVDASYPMLEQLMLKSAARGVQPRLCQMDARRLAFSSSFDIVLCPYSLVTYMSQPGDLEQMLGEVRAALVPGGLLVVDAFIPRTTIASSEYTLDYRRPIGNDFLTRYKRVSPMTAQVNRIERRYQVTSATGAMVQTLETSESIRTFSPEELKAALSTSGFMPTEEWWNYGHSPSTTSAQFFSLSARAASAI